MIAALGKVRQGTPALSYGDYKEVVLTNRQYAFTRNYDGVSVVVAVNNDDNVASLNLPADGASQYVGALSGEVYEVQGGRINVTIPANSGDIFVPVRDGVTVEPVQAAPIEDIPKPQSSVQPCGDEQITEPQETDESSEAKTEAVAAETEEVAAETAVAETVAAETAKAEAAETEGAEKKAVEQKEEGTYVDRSVSEGKTYEEMSVEELQEAVLAKMASNGPVTPDMLRTVRENVYHDSLVNWVKSFR